jgi:hypothetical protein
MLINTFTSVPVCLPLVFEWYVNFLKFDVVHPIVFMDSSDWKQLVVLSTICAGSASDYFQSL